MKKTTRFFSAVAIFIFLVSTFAVSASAVLIGKDGFYFEFDTNNNAILKEYHGSSEELIIPADIYGNPVIEVADYTFIRNSTIKSISIPDTVTRIGSNAFYGCTNLEKIMIPDSVVSFDSSVFAKCEKLTIYCYSDSEAEKYAVENGINYTLLDDPTPLPISETYLIGDIDLNNTINSADSLIILRRSVNLDELSELQDKLCDVDGNKEITSADALYVLRYSVHLPTVSDSLLGTSISYQATVE